MKHKEIFFKKPQANTILALHCDIENFFFAEFLLAEDEDVSLLHWKNLPLSLGQDSPEKVTYYLKEALTSWKSSLSKLHCFLPPRFIFSHKATLEIPLHLRTSLDQIIKLEAEQAIPLPLSDLVWDYQILSNLNKTSSQSLEIVYVALKKKIAEPLFTSIEKTGLKIESLNTPPAALMNTEAIKKIKGNVLTACFGAALESMTPLPCHINLLPASLLKARKIHQQLPSFLATTVVIASVLLLCSTILTKAAQKISLVNKQSLLLLDQQKKATATSQKMKTELTQMKEQQQQFLNLIKAHDIWPSLFNELQQHTPPRYLWITRLAAILGEKSAQNSRKQQSQQDESVCSPLITAIEVEGLYLENPHQAAIVDDFVNELKKSPLFVIEQEAPEKIITLRSTPRATDYAYPFRLQLPLRTAIKMESIL